MMSDGSPTALILRLFLEVLPAQSEIEEKKITNQGNKTGESSEGMWFSYSNVADSLVPINSNQDLVDYVSFNFS